MISRLPFDELRTGKAAPTGKNLCLPLVLKFVFRNPKPGTRPKGGSPQDKSQAPNLRVSGVGCQGIKTQRLKPEFWLLDCSCLLPPVFCLLLSARCLHKCFQTLRILYVIDLHGSINLPHQSPEDLLGPHFNKSLIPVFDQPFH